MSADPLEFDGGLAADVAFPVPEESPIVVVDDEPAVLDLLARVLQKEGYPVEAFASAHDALARVARGRVALLISDIQMPEMSGIELVRQALEEDPNLATIILTGVGDTGTAVESLRLGIDDYLEKPIAVNGLVESVGRSLRRRAQNIYRRKIEIWLREEVARRTAAVERRSEALASESVTTLSALVRAMEAKDPYLKGHSRRVSALCKEIGRALELPDDELEDLGVAGLLHDIGMIAVSESILHKAGQLTEEEYGRVRNHVEVGASILEPLPHLARAVELLRCHHERLNGSGYPRGLRGSDIPLAGQIVGLAESYAALTEERSFRPACSPVEAIDTLQGSRDIWYDGHAIDALQRVVAGRPGSARRRRA